jgi:very-short-patch-repair endonuclease
MSRQVRLVVGAGCSVPPPGDAPQMDADDLLNDLAELQHGYVLRRDARRFGLSAKAVRARLRAGDWSAEGPRLLRRRGAPLTKASRLMQAVLDAGPGAFLSVTTATAWWGLPGYDLLRIHVSRPRGITGVRPTFAHHLHEVLDLDPSQVTINDGIPIVRPERAMFELFATQHPGRATRAAEAAWTRGLVSGPSLHRTFERLFEQGRTGTVAGREFLEAHPVDWVPYGSGLESRVHELTAKARLGPWRRQVDLGDETWVGRVDFLAEDRPLVLEVQSELHHAALLDVAADARRKAALEAAGFVVVEVWDTDVWHRPHDVIAQLRAGWIEAGRRRPMVA